MFPVKLTISNFTINFWIIGLVLGCIVFIVINWNKLRENLSVEKIFDISIITIFLSFFFNSLVEIIVHFDTLQSDFTKILTIPGHDPELIGLVIGFFVSTKLISKTILKQERAKLLIFEQILISFIITLIIILIGALLSGKMLGVEVQNNIGLIYEGGIRRMPIGIFLITYLFCFLIGTYYFKKENKLNFNILNIIFLISISAFVFVLSFFTNLYKAEIFNILNIQQLFCLALFIIGCISLLSLIKVKDAQDPSQNRRMSSDLIAESKKMGNYSYTFSQNNIESKNNLSVKEKSRMAINSMKRRFRK